MITCLKCNTSPNKAGNNWAVMIYRYIGILQHNSVNTYSISNYTYQYFAIFFNVEALLVYSCQVVDKYLKMPWSWSCKCLLLYYEDRLINRM